LVDGYATCRVWAATTPSWFTQPRGVCVTRARLDRTAIEVPPVFARISRRARARPAKNPVRFARLVRIPRAACRASREFRGNLLLPAPGSLAHS
jgi:hypothetical protein